MCTSSAITRRSACLSGEDHCGTSAIEHWTEREIDEGAFKDARLGRRFGELLKQISDGMGGSIPFACQDWASTKAAYRFFANERVEEADILRGHFAATRARYEGCKGPILLIQDTTEFSYQRANTNAIGLSWRILWLTMLNRTVPGASPRMALTDTEIALLDQLVRDTGSCRPATLAFYLTKLARLGGYLARAGDPPPGIVVIWRGLSRLTDIELGAEIGATGFVGN
jgi:hypothetical protein